MKELEIYKIFFYEFTSSTELANKMLDLVTKLKYRKNASNETSEIDFLYDKELTDWINKCLKEVKNRIGIPENIELPITSCWANKSKKMEAHHRHNHPNSVLSGIFYLTSHQTSPTVFSFPNYWHNNIRNWDIINLQGESIKKEIFPEKGKLIIFPSDVYHFVKPVKENEERFTISFNTFLSGHLGADKEKTGLYIYTKSIEEINKEFKKS